MFMAAGSLGTRTARERGGGADRPQCAHSPPQIWSRERRERVCGACCVRACGRGGGEGRRRASPTGSVSEPPTQPKLLGHSRLSSRCVADLRTEKQSATLPAPGPAHASGMERGSMETWDLNVSGVL